MPSMRPFNGVSERGERRVAFRDGQKLLNEPIRRGGSGAFGEQTHCRRSNARVGIGTRAHDESPQRC